MLFLFDDSDNEKTWGKIFAGISIFQTKCLWRHLILSNVTSHIFTKMSR